MDSPVVAPGAGATTYYGHTYSYYTIGHTYSYSTIGHTHHELLDAPLLTTATAYYGHYLLRPLLTMATAYYGHYLLWPLLTTATTVLQAPFFYNTRTKQGTWVEPAEAVRLGIGGRA